MSYYEQHDWMPDAPCLGKAAYMWFPPMYIEDQLKNKFYEMGRAVCKTCPAWEECLERGADEAYGLWGGLTPVERRRPSKNHGGWVDYRRGCGCDDCSTAQSASLSDTPVDLERLPDAGDAAPTDPDSFLFNLF